MGQSDLRVETVASVILRDGWTCEYHEPDETCSQCRKLHLATARVVVEALDELTSRGQSGG